MKLLEFFIYNFYNYMTVKNRNDDNFKNNYFKTISLFSFFFNSLHFLRTRLIRLSK